MLRRYDSYGRPFPVYNGMHATLLLHEVLGRDPRFPLQRQTDSQTAPPVPPPPPPTNVAELAGTPKARARGLEESQNEERSDDDQRTKRQKIADSDLAPSRKNWKWDDWFDLLVEYQEEHEHTRVPYHFVDEFTGLRLGNWVSKQRTDFSRLQRGLPSGMTEERIHRLDSIGFEWKVGNSVETNARQPDVDAWETWFELLVEYQEENAHTRVPKSYVDASSGMKLGQWVCKQRAQYARKQRGLVSSMSEERINRLNSIGFEWQIREQGGAEVWETWFDLLVAYKDEHAHTRVPVAYVHSSSGLKLGQWVRNQRKQYSMKQKGQSARITEERIRRLDSIGFEWKVIEHGGPESWESSFQQLLEYKEEHAHTRVPPNYEHESTGLKLGQWVRTQMKQYSRLQRGLSSFLTEARMSRLDNIGFEWTIGEPRHSEPWESCFEQLVEYKGEHGNSCVPTSYVNETTGLKLGQWVGGQRYEYSRNKLSEERICLLESIGFKWKVYDKEAWETWFDLLVEYQEEHAHTRVPTRYVDASSGLKLGSWVANHRAQYARIQKGLSSHLSEERIRLFDSIGFEWKIGERGSAEVWETWFALLVDYHEKHAHTVVSRNYVDGPTGLRLGHWVRTQRKQYSKRLSGLSTPLTEEQVHLLDSFGFEWKIGDEEIEESWETYFELLLEYQEEHAHTRVPKNYVDASSGLDLGQWVYTQKSEHARRQLSPACVQRLDSICFEWDAGCQTEAWESCFELLVEYQEEHAHTRVPRNHVDVSSGLNLGEWVYTQRSEYSKMQLSLDCIQRLDNIGFEWNINHRTESWDTWFALLLEYKERNAHTRVPKTYVDASSGLKLGQWVYTQRTQYSKKQKGHYSTLTEEREHRLDSIGFEWKVLESHQPAPPAPWESWFDLLVAYKEEHAHTRVPVNYVHSSSGLKLGQWVRSQRKQYSMKQKGQSLRLTEEREHRLNSIGFEWEIREQRSAEPWESWFDLLVAYKEEHEHTRVPQTYVDASSGRNLGHWANHQRTQYARLQRGLSSYLTEERIHRLDSIGFVWKPDVEGSAGSWEAWFELLVEYKQEHAHTRVPYRYVHEPSGLKLGVWVHSQRYHYTMLQKGQSLRLTEDRKQKLDSIGFEWSVLQRGDASMPQPLCYD